MDGWMVGSRWMCGWAMNGWTDGLVGEGGWMDRWSGRGKGGWLGGLVEGSVDG